MRKLERSLLALVLVASFLTSPLFAESSISPQTLVTPPSSQSDSSQRSELLLQKLTQALELLIKSNKEIASLKAQLQAAKTSSDKSADRIANLEVLLSQAQALSDKSAEKIKNLEEFLAQAQASSEALRLTTEQLQTRLDEALTLLETQSLEVATLKSSLESALTSSSNIEAINKDLLASTAKDQARIKVLKLQNGILIGGCVVTFVGGVALGAWLYSVFK